MQRFSLQFSRFDLSASSVAVKLHANFPVVCVIKIHKVVTDTTLYFRDIAFLKY